MLLRWKLEGRLIERQLTLFLVLRDTFQVGTGTNLSGLATYQNLAA